MLSQQIEKIIESLVPAYAQFLQALVRAPSQYGREAECQAIVEARMTSLGYDVAKIYSRSDADSANLAVRIKGAGSGKSLVLNAHADVTPVEGDWKYPPYDAVIEDGILFGRGAQDDKAGIAVILMVADCLQLLGISLNGDLILQVVVDDETSGDGSKALVDAGYSGDGVVICDGTWPERIIYGHLGQLWLDVEISGSAVAACVESRGVNPIYIGCEYTTKLRAWADEMNTKSAHFENVERPFFVNVGSFHSGVWHGSVPVNAALEIQIGFGPGLQPSDVLKIAKDLAADVSSRIQISQGLLATPAVMVPEDNELIVRLKPIIENNSRKDVRTQVVTGHCDMRHFRTEKIGLYGPGAGWNAHGIDESYRLNDMVLVARNLTELAISWCGVGPGASTSH